MGFVVVWAAVGGEVVVAQQVPPLGYRVMPLAESIADEEGLVGRGFGVAALNNDLTLALWPVYEGDTFEGVSLRAQWLHVPSGQWLGAPQRILTQVNGAGAIAERRAQALVISFDVEDSSGWLRLQPPPEGLTRPTRHALPIAVAGGESGHDLLALALDSDTLLFSYDEDLDLEVRRIGSDLTVQGERLGKVVIPGRAFIFSFQVMTCAADLWLAYPIQGDFIIRRGLSLPSEWAAVGIASSQGHQLLCLHDTPYVAASRTDGRVDTPYLLDLSGGHALPADALAWQPIPLSRPISDGSRELTLLTSPTSRDALPLLVSAGEAGEEDAQDLYVLTFPSAPLALGALPMGEPVWVGSVSGGGDAQPEDGVMCALLPSGAPVCAASRALIPSGDVSRADAAALVRVGPAVFVPDMAPALGASASQVEAAKQMLDAVAVELPYSEDLNPVQSWACGPSMPDQGPDIDEDDPLFGALRPRWLSCDSDEWLALADAVDARCARQPDPAHVVDPSCPWLQLHFSCLKLFDERDIMRTYAEESPWIYQDFEERPCVISRDQARDAEALTYFTPWRSAELVMDEATALNPQYWLGLSFAKVGDGRWELEEIQVHPPASAPSLAHAALAVGLPQLCAQAAPGEHQAVCAAAIADFKAARIAPVSAYGLRYARDLRYCQCDEVLSEGYLIRWRRAHDRWWLQSVEPKSCSDHRCY